MDNGLQIFEAKVIFSLLFYATINFGLNLLTSIGIFVVFNAVFLIFLMLKYKQNDGTLGEHLIDLREQNLLEVSDVNETLHSWKSVQKIIDLKNYVLIYVSPTNAHIVPKRFFSSSEEAKSFLDELNRLKDSATANYSPSYLASNV